MNLDQFRTYCLSFQGVTEETPFDKVTLVFKVMGKMFALADMDNFESINLKCEPNKAIELREQYDAVKEGYHMSKKHWNTILVNGSVSDQIVFQWIDHSYALIISSFPKKIQEQFDTL